MPTYTYECERCAGRFELEQRITDPPRRRCPSCRGKVFRVIHPVGHILKGPGFYATDYRKPAPAEGGDDPAPSPPACEGCAKKDGCGS